MKCNNASCGKEIEAGDKFCNACGMPVSGLDSSTNDFENFFYLINEDYTRRVDAINIKPPYGAVGVTVVDDVVDKVHLPNGARPNGGNVFSDLINSALEFASGLLGSKKQNVQTYVLVDLRSLPICRYSRALAIPGQDSASLNFNLWVDFTNKELLAKFMHRYVLGNKRQGLSLRELSAHAGSAIEEILAGKDLANLVTDDSQLQDVLLQLEKIFGISGVCDYRRGREVERRDYAISQLASSIQCPKCSASCKDLTKFCEQCGTPLNVADFAGSRRFLVSKDGTRITVRLSGLFVEARGSKALTEEEFKNDIFDVLAREVVSHTFESFKDAETLSSISKHVGQWVDERWPGSIVDLELVDIASTEEGWIFGVDALIEDELQKIEANKKALQIDESQLDYKEAAFAIALRRLRQNDTEQLAARQLSLDTKRQSIDLDLQEHALDTDKVLRQNKIDDEAKIVILDRQVELERHETGVHRSRVEMEIDREQTNDALHKSRIQLEGARLGREDQIAQDALGRSQRLERMHFDHEKTMEASALRHDLDLQQASSDADRQNRREELDLEVQAQIARSRASKLEKVDDIEVDGMREEQSIRLDGARQEQRQRIELDGQERSTRIEEDALDRRQHRELSKLEKMAEMEANMAKQDQSHAIAMAELSQTGELEKHRIMRGLDPAQILAMQAAELARASGDGQATADIVKSIAESQAAQSGAGIKEELYQEMLKRQQEFMAQQRADHQEAMQAAYGASSKAMENMRDLAKAVTGGTDTGYKEAAKIAQSVNEKSMDVMAKVATAAVSKKGVENKDDDKKDVNTTPCSNPDCNHVFKGKPGKFCPKCGQAQET